MKLTSGCLAGFVSMCLVAACGGGGASDIDGPILTVSEARSMVVDQLYINGGMDDEYGSQGEFSIYLRDAATGMDVTCASAGDGMAKLSAPGIYYGGLSVHLREVIGDHPSSLARFEVVFVEQDSQGCPNPISDEDDVAGVSDEFTFEGLLDDTIWASNGRAAVVFRQSQGSSLAVSSMAPALDSGLAIDKLYFNNGSEGNESARYYIFAEEIVDGQSVYQCQVDDSYVDDINYGGIVYSALGFPLECFDAADPGFEDIVVRIGLYIQRASGPALVGETRPRAIGELIGERADFTNGKGYVSFRSVMTTPFSAPVVRLGEITSLTANALSYQLTPSYNPNVEIHVTDANGDYIIACAGSAQGLTGISSPGTHTGLDAALVPADGQRELFGWDGVLVRLVDRLDNLACPSPLASAPTVLATTAPLGSRSLGAGLINFLNGAGSVTLSMSSQ